ncbi:MAG: hypothetical protein Q9181_001509 [Wetmoreana brouardii]
MSSPPPYNALIEVYTWSHTFPHKGEKEWAIRHQYIRSELLHAAQTAAAQGDYFWRHAQPHGPGLGATSDDYTAPCPYPWSQRNWGWNNRAHFPWINFRLEKTDYKPSFKYVVPDWYHNGLLVLDLHGRPMRKFWHLPDTISSKIPEGHIEALMRFDDKTTYSDIRGRMPPKVISHYRGKTNTKEVQSIGALAAATSRYRESAGCLNWKARTGSEAINNFILANLPAEFRRRNTTQGWRALTKAEIASIREPAVGSRPENATKRASSQEARDKREEHFQRTKTRFARAQGAVSSSDQNLEQVASTFESPAHNAEDEEPNMDILDSRNDVPTTPQQIEALRQAIFATITHLQAILGHDTQPFLSPNLSYVQQIEILQRQVNDTYQAINDTEDEAPTLIQLTSWMDGIDNWRSAAFWNQDNATLYSIDEQGGIGSVIKDDTSENADSEMDVEVHKSDWENEDESLLQQVDDDDKESSGKNLSRS